MICAEGELASVSYLRQQDKATATRGYRPYKLSVVLSQMPTRSPNQCQKLEYVRYKRARRTDAEPITHRSYSCGYRLCI